MFEISGSDVAALTDVDLRSLVARLSLAELRKGGLPLSAVTAGGRQTAPDGGLDVRVSVNSSLATLDFVPRAVTGFQVKKSDISASEIMEEMRPKGVLRPVFSDLSAKDGAYIIVSAQGSVSDKPLQDRKNAMRSALAALEDADRLFVDFYDRDRIATWTNIYPGVAAWVMGRLGRQLNGWSAIGKWASARAGEADDYLSDDRTCVVDERTLGREQIGLLEGVARIRRSLSQPGCCARLVGLSGVGKTRLVQALFDENLGVNEEALDPSIAIYTDYSDSIDPTARDMARQLVAAGSRAFLVVDNCNPSTHRDLTKICGGEGSLVSLLTVEYDVRDDEPEHTEVFRLQTCSAELVSQWIGNAFPYISQVDRDRIANFSDGNFGVARALAETLKRGETLGQLKSRDLFARIFEQRSAPSLDLLRAAEDLSLVHSYDGEDTSPGSELACLASIRSLSAQVLFGATAELKARGVAQSRGRWRALLPHALANRLAAFALERIPAADFDAFYLALPPRLLRSLSRRLGYLHDSHEAGLAVERWLTSRGPLADLTTLDDTAMSILRNVAPVVPQAVLAKIIATAKGSKSDALLAMPDRQRRSLISLTKALAFEPTMFDDAVSALSYFACAELPEGSNSAAIGHLRELFHLCLSGTQATIEQRVRAIRRLAGSPSEKERQCSMFALDGLLESAHFSSMSSFDFGARPRDYGWEPKTLDDQREWFSNAIRLAIDLKHIPEVSGILSRHLRALCSRSGCLNDLDAAATAFSDGRAWIDGWIGFRAALRFEGAVMPNEDLERLRSIIKRLQPVGLVDQARALVLAHSRVGYSVADDADDPNNIASIGEAYRRANEAAVDVGKAVAISPAEFNILVPEILSAQDATRAFEFGRGLALGCLDLKETWAALVDAHSAVAADARNISIVGGFLTQSQTRDASFVAAVLDAAVIETSLCPLLPYLQACVSMDNLGIERLRAAVSEGRLESRSFWCLASGSIGAVTPADLAHLLTDIADLPGGVEVCIEILHIYLHFHHTDIEATPTELIHVGRKLLESITFSRGKRQRNGSVQTVISHCLVGQDATRITFGICKRIRKAIAARDVSLGDISQLVDGIFATHPLVALDAFLLGEESETGRMVSALQVSQRLPIAKIDADILTGWADQDAEPRYRLLSNALNIFQHTEGGNGLALSTLFLAVLDKAPDPTAFLGEYYGRFHPRGGWSGSLADVLEKRWELVRALLNHRKIAVQQWVADGEAPISRWIEEERQRDRKSEETFE